MKALSIAATVTVGLLAGTAAHAADVYDHLVSGQSFHETAAVADVATPAATRYGAAGPDTAEALILGLSHAEAVTKGVPRLKAAALQGERSSTPVAEFGAFERARRGVSFSEGT
ncbi:hypothetical protein [Arhodomonas sp. AD133]|uniref:hypothetical protein n=1 Tax=Arhodomonas sp. AD133 TaxID=3415009 RepID=UPI003EBAF457